MAISFSGLASGMDTSSWVEALVSVKQQEITKLESNRATINEAQSVLNNIKSYFSSFQSLLENITDAKFGIASKDLFSQNLAESSNVSILSATASTSAENTTYNIEVKQLATATEVNSGINIVVPETVSETAKLQSTLFSLGDNITAGNIVFNIDNNIRSIAIDENTTIDNFIDALDGIGISASYNEDTGIFSLGTSVPTSKFLEVASGDVSMETKLKDLGITDNNLCNFNVIQENGTTVNVNTLTKESTIEDLFNKLSEYGINAHLENGKITLSGARFEGALADELGFSGSTMQLYNDETGVIAALGLQDVNYGYKTNLINVVTTTTASGTATTETKLKDLGIDAEHCSFIVSQIEDYICADSPPPTISAHIMHYDDMPIGEYTDLTPESTLGDVINAINSFGLHASLNSDGTLTITSDIEHIASNLGQPENDYHGISYNYISGSLAEALGLATVATPETPLIKMTSTAIVHSTVETVVHRDSTLSQIGAYQNVGDNIVIRACDDGAEVATINTLNGDSTVQDFFNAITAYGITGSISDGVITLNSTSGNFIDGNIASNIGILKPVMETYYTTASTAMTSSTNIDTSTTLGALGMSSDGSVVIYSPVYGIVSVNIQKELTVQGFCDKINDSNYGIHAEIQDNKVKITELANSGAYVKGMSTVIQNALKLTVGEGNSYNSTEHFIYANTDSSYLKYNDTGVEINADTVISSIGDYSHGNGTIRLWQNGVASTITVDQTLTLGEFINDPIVGLAQYGLSGQILSDGKVYITSDNGTYLAEIGQSNILKALNLTYPQVTWSGERSDSVNNLQYTLTVTTTVAATKDTALTTWDYKTVQAGVTTTVSATGTLVFKTNDYYKTVHIDSGDTFSTLIQKLDNVGIKASITKGVFYIESGYDNVEFVRNESSSSLSDLIHLNTTAQNLGNYSASSRPVISTVTNYEDQIISAANYADMSTKLSTIGISDGKLTVYRNGQRADIEIGTNDTFSSLQSRLTEKFSDLRVSFDNGYLKIYSTDSNASISIGSTSDKSNFVAITGIASTKQNELTSSRQMYMMNDRSTLDDGDYFRDYKGISKDYQLKTVGITAGNVTLKKGSEEKNIQISSTETFESLQAKIQEQFSDLYIDFDENGCLRNGTLSVRSNNSSETIKFIQASSGASNFIEALEMPSSSTAGAISSKQITFKDVMSGSFKIGDADIYIQADDSEHITTTISDIVAQINASDTSLATAYWDSIDGKLVIKSRLTGASAVNIEGGSTVFTDLLGLTNGDNLKMDSQTIGKNAILTINGATYTSLSNNVGQESTGLVGLNINLKGLSNDSVVTLTVKRDTETLKNAIQNVVDGYNELITNIDNAISKTGKLKNQSLLKLIRNNIRTAMTSSDAGASVFKNLSAIGIKAADASAGNISTSDSTITLLSLNAEEFLKAYESDEDAVKALLIGSSDASENIINKGIFTKVEELVESALMAGSGYFATANDAYNSDKENISQKIVNGTAAIEKYRAKLEKKFSAMDIMIANMQNQFKSFLG